MSPSAELPSDLPLAEVGPALRAPEVDDAPPEVLPLRLSVSRGALAIELTQPRRQAAYVVTELEVHLDGVQFPVDLSRGVKQFRHRRGTLKRLSIELDLEALGRLLQPIVADALGEPLLGVRILPRPLEDAASKIGPSPPTLGSLSFCLFGATRALSFDLVLGPGKTPSFIVDQARGLDLERPALEIILSALERGLRRTPLGLVRQGRTIQVTGLARAVLADTLSALGFRLPRLEDPVVHRALFGPAGVTLTLSAGETPVALGARAIRLAGLAEFAKQADDLLAAGDADGARRTLLEVLERVPGHPDILLTLASIDAFAEGRGESALAFLEEARRRQSAPDSVEALLSYRVLGRGLSPELGREVLGRALLREPDGVLAALAHSALSVTASSVDEALAELDRAVSRAPAHPEPRRLRLLRQLERGSLEAALVDAEQLEASASPGAERARVAGFVGRTFGEHGYTREAIAWLRRALVGAPDDLAIRLQLGLLLCGSGELLRGAEVLQVALTQAASFVRAGQEADVAPEDELDAARLALAEIVASAVSDVPLALGYARAIGSRGRYALEGRRLEVRLARSAGDRAAERSALLRLLQAIEVGWIERDSAAETLAEIVRDAEARGDADLAAHAARLQQATVTARE